jgi:predicted nucleic acid-binding protein
MARMIDFFVDTNVLIYIIDLDDSVKEMAIAIKQNCSIELADSIIAATAKCFDLPLVTADKDFNKIKEVDIVLLDLKAI